MTTTTSFGQSGQQVVSFSQPVNLSNDNNQAEFPWVATSGSNVYVAWTEASHGIYFRSSSNYGAAWNPAIKLSPSGTAAYPVIALNGSFVYVVWSQSLTSGGNSVVYIDTSSNYGATFSSAATPLSPATANSNIPYVAEYGSNVYVIWHEVSSGSQSVRVTSSNNNGQTWPRSPSELATSGDEPQIAAWGDYVYATWDRGGAWFDVSSNNGQSWLSKSVNLNSPNAGLQREPWISASGSNVYVTWNDNSGFGSASSSNYNAYIRVSNNNGKTWTPKTNLFPGGTSDWEVQS
ncbi:MAG: sialidase family protein, partial [Nitrososphaerales archaeon]